jgi:hypothetical protein
MKWTWTNDTVLDFPAALGWSLVHVMKKWTVNADSDCNYEHKKVCARLLKKSKCWAETENKRNSARPLKTDSRKMRISGGGGSNSHCKTWICECDLELKHQNIQWKSEGFSRLKKMCLWKLKVKAIVICFLLMPLQSLYFYNKWSVNQTVYPEGLERLQNI